MALGRVVSPPKNWHPWISEGAPYSVKARSARKELREQAAVDEDAAPPLLKTLPYQASIALSTGACRGQPLVFGARITSEGTANDSVCIGVEVTGDYHSGCLMSVMLAPFAGRCFVQQNFRPRTLHTQGVPKITDDSVTVWVQITGSGDIRFLRQVHNQPLEQAGFLPADCLPCWACQFFGAIHFFCRDMHAKEIDVSIIYSGSSFPSSLHAHDIPNSTAEMVWTVMQSN